MKTCTFFGHRDTPESIGDALLQAIEELITRENVLRFYVGNQGRFDALVLSALRQLKKVYPQIEYAVVLAYLPKRELFATPEETLFPEEVATALPRQCLRCKKQIFGGALRLCDGLRKRLLRRRVQIRIACKKKRKNRQKPCRKCDPRKVKNRSPQIAGFCFLDSFGFISRAQRPYPFSTAGFLPSFF